MRKSKYLENIASQRNSGETSLTESATFCLTALISHSAGRARKATLNTSTPHPVWAIMEARTFVTVPARAAVSGRNKTVSRHSTDMRARPCPVNHWNEITSSKLLKTKI